MATHKNGNGKPMAQSDSAESVVGGRAAVVAIEAKGSFERHTNQWARALWAEVVEVIAG